MSEERVNNLAELYDRTKKCTGISVPKNCAILIDIPGSEEFFNLYHNCSLTDKIEENINILMVTLAGELMIAGVEEIFVIPVSLPFDDPENNTKIFSSLGKNLNNFRVSMRPNATIKIAVDTEYSSGYGSFDSAVIIEGPKFDTPRTTELGDHLLKQFLSPKTILLNTFYCKSCAGLSEKGRLMFSKEIISWSHQSVEAKKFKRKSIPDDDLFALDSRVVTQAVFMLCSNELESCFHNIPQSFDAMQIDGNLLSGIFAKFALQGFNTKELEGLTSPYFQEMITNMSEYGQWYKNKNLLSEDHRIRSIDREDEINFYSEQQEPSSEWNSAEYQDLLSREDHLAHPDLATNVSEGSENDGQNLDEEINTIPI